MMAATDWAATGQNIVLLLIGIVTAWNAYRAGKTAKTVNQIHTLTNSAMGLALKSLAEATAAKAVLTKDGADLLAAQKARTAWQEHDVAQAKVDAGEQ